MGSNLVETRNLASALRDFLGHRDLDQSHTPKNPAIALAVEAAELLEPFQWLTPDQSHEPRRTGFISRGEHGRPADGCHWASRSRRP